MTAASITEIQPVTGIETMPVGFHFELRRYADSWFASLSTWATVLGDEHIIGSDEHGESAEVATLRAIAVFNAALPELRDLANATKDPRAVVQSVAMRMREKWSETSK